jgi:endoglucanase
MTEYIEKYFKELGFSPRVLPNGTVISTNSKNQILITAHCDEIGFMISKGQDGKTYVLPLGGSSPTLLNNTEIIGTDFLSKKAFSGKLTWKGSDQTVKNLWDFVEADLQDSPKVLSPLTFAKNIVWQDDVVKAPGLDNKVGLTALLLLAKVIKDENLPITLAAVTQEETSSWGIDSLINTVKPELVIDIDSAYGATEKADEAKSIPILGKGAALQVYGSQINPERELIAKVTKLLTKMSIPFQYEIPAPNTGGTILSTAMPFMGNYFLQVNIPVMDQHTAVSTANINDVTSAGDILKTICTQFCLQNLSI